MAMNVQGLGKGLDALIRETRTEQASAGIQQIALTAIEPNPGQPRHQFSDKALEDLAASIKSQGVLQPILVRPVGDAAQGKYQIVAGERRWRASRLAGLTEVPVIVRNFTDQEALAVALIENLQREDLNPIEEALALQTLKDEYGLSQEDLSQRLGKSRSAVANSLRLLALPEDIRLDLSSGKLTAGHARALLSISSDSARKKLHSMILEEQLSVREAEGLAALWKKTGSFVQQPPAGEQPEPLPRPALPGSLERVQKVLHSVFQVPVKVTGKEDKGKISLSYSSREELLAILNRMGAAGSMARHDSGAEESPRKDPAPDAGGETA